MTDLNKIRDRIRALMEKTCENGATEAEALAAAEKAREMMDKYNITVTIETVEKTGAEDAEIAGVSARDLIVTLAGSIADFTDCKAWRSSQRRTVTFMGVGPDAEFARDLFNTLRRSRDAGLAAWRASDDYRAQLRAGYAGVSLGNTFTSAFVRRVSERLAELKRESEQRASASRALVPVKAGIIAAEMRARKIHLSSSRGRRTVWKNEAAQAAGRAAGERATIGRGQAALR